jgi:dATP pyrophosphohydrolase
MTLNSGSRLPAVWKRETAPQAAAREVKEEVAIDVAREQLTLKDCQRTVEFEIFSHLRHRYAPGTERNTESWFCLALPMNGRSCSPNT